MVEMFGQDRMKVFQMEHLIDNYVSVTISAIRRLELQNLASQAQPPLQNSISASMPPGLDPNSILMVVPLAFGTCNCCMSSTAGIVLKHTEEKFLSIYGFTEHRNNGTGIEVRL
ncbi:conserved hypothetical protein [Ricinus communis]|uniref:Uncharacterized protein n=1 Tax=Ricinus communis TaxID=3988 RepID=B9T4Z0_RICCO|nr:conserved hypothetical protein [Ricinus communis]